jgi:chemotaxis protein methyltransferase CheR
MEAVGAKSPREYLDRLTASAARDTELRALLNEITVGETCLFRAMPQVEALRSMVLPELVQAKTKLSFKKLRVWSAGCSTGEEPYTFAMILLEDVVAKLPGWTLEIVATDLNDRSLDAARQGVYGEYALRNTPDYFRQKYMMQADNRWQVKPDVKALVNFSRLTLAEDAKILFMKGFDFISCCNVLIYFDGASKTRVINHFFNGLVSGGYFFIGQSESLYGIQSGFHLVHFPKATGYFKPVPGAVKGGRP